MELKDQVIRLIEKDEEEAKGEGKFDFYKNLYLQLRSEITDHSKKVSNARLLSIVLAGALVGVIFQIATVQGILIPDLNNRPNLIVAAITISSVINSLFYRYKSYFVRGIHSMGAYLWAIEKKLDLKYGWEDWVYKKYFLLQVNTKESKKKTVLKYFSEDIQVLIGSIYLVVTIASVVIIHGISLVVLMFSILVQTICLWLMLRLSKLQIIYRQKKFRELIQNWNVKFGPNEISKALRGLT